jgi:uroporphyrinogen decarboxylase
MEAYKENLIRKELDFPVDIFILDVMEDLINIAKIDAKHSNEDQIAPFPEWVARYGDRIGNFGGVDTDHLCRKNEQEIKEIVIDVMNYSVGHGGFALGSGNSIPAYVPVAGYLAMVEAAREFRRK